MGGLSRFHNGGAFCKAIPLLQNVAVTAGGSGDDTQVSSGWINVAGYGSAKVVIQAKSTIAANKALNMTAGLQDATDSSGDGNAAYGSGVTAKQMDGNTGTPETNNLTTMELDYDLAGARGFIEFQMTPDMTATGTDTSNLSAVLLLFGSGEEPSSQHAN